MDKKSDVASIREALLKESEPNRRERETGKVVSIFGGQGIAVGDNNTINVTHVTKSVRRTVIDPNGGELTPYQKQRLQGLVDGIVAAAGQRVTYPAVWKRLQRRFKVNSYHALRADQYEPAKKYLKTLYGRAKKGEI